MLHIILKNIVYLLPNNYTDSKKMENKTYEQSMTRLEEITRKIENRELNIDELSTYLKEAQQLLKFCKDKLYKTDAEIQKILDKEGAK